MADYAVSSLTTGPHPMWFEGRNLLAKVTFAMAASRMPQEGLWCRLLGRDMSVPCYFVTLHSIFLACRLESGEICNRVLHNWCSAAKRVPIPPMKLNAFFA